MTSAATASAAAAATTTATIVPTTICEPHSTLGGGAASNNPTLATRRQQSQQNVHGRQASGEQQEFKRESVNKMSPADQQQRRHQAEANQVIKSKGTGAAPPVTADALLTPHEGPAGQQQYAAGAAAVAVIATNQQRLAGQQVVVARKRGRRRQQVIQEQPNALDRVFVWDLEGSLVRADTLADNRSLQASGCAGGGETSVLASVNDKVSILSRRLKQLTLTFCDEKLFLNELELSDQMHIDDVPGEQQQQASGQPASMDTATALAAGQNADSALAHESSGNLHKQQASAAALSNGCRLAASRPLGMGENGLQQAGTTASKASRSDSSMASPKSSNEIKNEIRNKILSSHQQQQQVATGNLEATDSNKVGSQIQRNTTNGSRNQFARQQHQFEASKPNELAIYHQQQANGVIMHLHQQQQFDTNSSNNQRPDYHQQQYHHDLHYHSHQQAALASEQQEMYQSHDAFASAAAAATHHSHQQHPHLVAADAQSVYNPNAPIAYHHHQQQTQQSFFNHQPHLRQLSAQQQQMSGYFSPSTSLATIHHQPNNSDLINQSNHQQLVEPSSFVTSSNQSNQPNSAAYSMTPSSTSSSASSASSSSSSSSSSSTSTSSSSNQAVQQIPTLSSITEKPMLDCQLNGADLLMQTTPSSDYLMGNEESRLMSKTSRNVTDIIGVEQTRTSTTAPTTCQQRETLANDVSYPPQGSAQVLEAQINVVTAKAAAAAAAAAAVAYAPNYPQAHLNYHHPQTHHQQQHMSMATLAVDEQQPQQVGAAVGFHQLTSPAQQVPAPNGTLFEAHQTNQPVDGHLWQSMTANNDEQVPSQQHADHQQQQYQHHYHVTPNHQQHFSASHQQHVNHAQFVAQHQHHQFNNHLTGSSQNELLDFQMQQQTLSSDTTTAAQGERMQSLNNHHHMMDVNPNNYYQHHYQHHQHHQQQQHLHGHQKEFQLMSLDSGLENQQAASTTHLSQLLNSQQAVNNNNHHIIHQEHATNNLMLQTNQHLYEQPAPHHHNHHHIQVNDYQSLQHQQHHHNQGHFAQIATDIHHQHHQSIINNHQKSSTLTQQSQGIIECARTNGNGHQAIISNMALASKGPATNCSTTAANSNTTLRNVMNSHHKQITQRLSVRFHRIKTTYNLYKPGFPYDKTLGKSVEDDCANNGHQPMNNNSNASPMPGDLPDILRELDHYTLDWRRHAIDCLKLISESPNCTNIIITRMPLVIALGHLVCLGFSQFFDIDQVYSASKSSKDACIKRVKKRFGATNRCSYIIVGDKDDADMAKRLDLPCWSTTRSDGHRQLVQLYTALKEGYLM